MNIDKINLKGLTLASAQTYGNVRMIPLIRNKIRGDLRIGLKSYDEDYSVVDLNDKTKYTSYIPHGFIVNWDNNGSPICSFGTELYRKNIRKDNKVRVKKRMVKKIDKNKLRLLPLHLSMEYYLAQHFFGSDIIWDEYSKDFTKYGLGSRSEFTYSGSDIYGLEKALKVFEINENQVGVLLYIADAFTSAFIVSHPNDYRKLHNSLVEDFYCDLIQHYNYLYKELPDMFPKIDDSNINSINDLRKALDNSRSDLKDFYNYTASNLLDCYVESKNIYKMGTFNLYNFITYLDEQNENHIGECIYREDGEIEYLKTYRLDKDQTNRIKLLKTLDKYDWNLRDTARSMNQSKNSLIQYIDKLGFGYILKPDILKNALNSL
ncbi:MAG: hypothetical protein GY714_28225 [Desulfobacterales bacterium]|nr:hypothetical protein [Desulfobacterales bacterium]